jgi:hypothetical protein
MRHDELETQWRQLTAAVLADMVAWRRQHPKATLAAIEAALDERWAKARAQIVADTALTSTLADLTQLPKAERPPCTQCGALLQVHGRATRRLQTAYEQDISLPRSYASCPACGQGVFPPG